MKRLLASVVCMMGGVVLLAGCGDDANLEDYSAPLEVIERTEFFLTGLKDQKLPSPGFDPPNDLALSYSGELIRVEHGIETAVRLIDGTFG